MTETSSAGVQTSIQHTNILALSSLTAFFADSLIKADNNIPVGIIQSSRGGSAINIWSENGRLYNNHIAPLEGLNIAGILWYQGCANSNATGFKTYSSDFKKLIQKYRSVFKDNELPFLYVQLAPYKNDKPEYESAGSQRFQVMREIQREMLNDNDINTNLYMAVSMDTTQNSHHDTNGNIVNQSLIHPLGKDTLGQRMANAYLGMTKNDNRVISGPLVDKAEVSGNTITVSFKEGTAEGLQILNPDYTYQHNGTTGWKSDTTSLEEFKIAGEDGVYYDANAVIDGNTVKVSSDRVSSPKYVSYAYSELPKNPNLANAAGIPASPFNIGVGGAAAPTAAPETAPTASPTPTPTPAPDYVDFSYAPDDTMKRGVETAIADIGNYYYNAPDTNMQLEDGDVVAVIGDSITQYDYWLSYLSQIYAAKKPNDKVKFYNMGVGGNTAPDSLDILDQEFALVEQYDHEKPNNAIIMLGMNDVNLENRVPKGNGAAPPAEATAPPDDTPEENAAQFKENVTALIDAVQAKGITNITVMSATPYDDTMEGTTVIPRGYKDARNRLIEFSEELETITKAKNCNFINLTKPMYALLDEYQKDDKSATFINAADRVHPRECGNYVMAYLIAKAHGLSNINSETEITVNDSGANTENSSIQNLQKTDDNITFTYTPSGKTIGLTKGYAEADQIVPITKDFNQEIVKFDGLTDGYYDLDMDGYTAGPYSAEELENGINLAVIENGPVAKQNAQLNGAMYAGHLVVSDIRNIRRFEQQSMIKWGYTTADLNDADKMQAFIDSNAIPANRTIRMVYESSKGKEQELFTQYRAYADLMYDWSRVEPVNITLRPSTVNNESVLFNESFSEKFSTVNSDTRTWKPAMNMPGNGTDADHGSESYDPTTGSSLTGGSGAGSAKFEVGRKMYRGYYTLTDHIPVLPGQEYTVSASVKTQDVYAGDTVNMSVIFYKSDDSTQVGNVITIDDTQKGTHDWTKISQTIKVPDDAAYMRLDISTRGTDANETVKKGIAWFDDVRVSSKLNNADFETAADGIVSGWTTEDIPNPIPENYNADMMTFNDKSKWTVAVNGTAPSDGTSVTRTFETDSATGNPVVKFTSTVTNSSLNRGCYIYPSANTDYIKLKPNTSYKITMRAKVENYKLLLNDSQAGLTYTALLYKESSGAVGSVQYTLTNNRFGVSGSTAEEKTADWADYSMILTTPAAEDGQTYQYLRSNVMMRFASGTAWVDSIKVEECDADGNVITLNNADTENKVSGNQSLLVNGGANANGVTYSSEPIMVTGTQKYLFGAYAKKDTGATGKISIEAYSSQGTKLDTTEVDVESADFAKAEREITMPENAVYAVVKLNAANGNMNVDDLCLSKITSERDRAYSFTGTPGEVSVYAEDGIIIIATYNADKSLQSIVISGSVKANDPISEITVEENQKAFVWTSLNDMKPVGTKQIKKN